MNRKVYCACDSDFSSHNKQQLGRGYSDIAIYKGHPYQRGYGIGSFLKRYGIPVLKFLGKHVLRTGLNVGEDILQDRNFGESVKNRSKEGLREAAKDSIKKVRSFVMQKGSGLRNRRTQKGKKSHKSISPKIKKLKTKKRKKRTLKAKRRTKRDIFS